MRIRDCMTEHPHSIRDTETMANAEAMMTRLGVRHLPVLSGGHLVGMITQRDIYFVNTYGDTADVAVEDAMSPDVYSVPPNASLNSVAAHMAENKLGSAVVMEGGDVIGIFTVTDALTLLSDHTRS